MGAWQTSQIAAGKTPAEAYDRAVADATAEYGHQQGYSGAINSKDHGFVLVALPARMTYEKLLKVIEDFADATDTLAYTDPRHYLGPNGKARRGFAKQLRDARREIAKATKTRDRILADPRFRGMNIAALVETYRDKWAAPLAVELKGAEAKRYATLRCRGERVFVFFGYAPC